MFKSTRLVLCRNAAIAGLVALALALSCAPLPDLDPTSPPQASAVEGLDSVPSAAATESSGPTEAFTSVPATPAPTPDLEATVAALVAQHIRAELKALPETSHPTIPAPVGDTPSLDPSGQQDIPSSESTPVSLPFDQEFPAGELVGMVDEVKAGVVRVNASSGVGSGVIIEALEGRRGLVLTNYHVVADAYRIDVLVGDSRTFRGRVVGYDENRDLAVVEICCDDFRTLPFSDVSEVSPGSDVVAIGYALGLTGSATVTRGIVSAVRYHPTMKAWVFQTDASINPGNSGGPLLLANGQVIGITTFVQSRDNQGKPTSGLGFAISARSIREILPDLKTGSKIGLWPNNQGAGTSAQGLDDNWKTYTSQAHGYLVRVPTDWLVDDSDQGHVHFESPDGFAGLAVIANRDNVLDLENWIDEIIEQHRNFYQGRFRLLERNAVTYSDGTSGASVVFRAQTSSQFCLLRVTELFHLSDGGNFVKSFQICEHSYSEYSSVQQAVLSSFEVP